MYQKMKPTFDTLSYLVLSLGLLITLVVAALFSQPREMMALASGYILFAVNYVLIAKLYQTLLFIMRFGSGNSRARLLVTLGSGLKFIGLIGALYFLLVQ